MKLVKRFPPGYIEEESIYCQAEEKALFECTEAPFHADKVRARNRLLSKREEFKRIYYKRK